MQIDFDPKKTSFEALLAEFWKSHDPYRSGGSRQYMNVLFYHDEAQQRIAEAARDRIERETGRKVVTPILPVGTFTLAEDYHQKFRLRQAPALEREFLAIYPRLEDFVNSTAAARVNGILGGYGRGHVTREDLARLGLSEQAILALENRLRR